VSIVKRFFWLGLILFLGFILYLDISVVSRFSGQKWRLPSHVYARPLELYERKELSLNDLIWELDALGYRSKAQLYGAGQYRVNNNSVDIRTRGFVFWDGIDSPQNLKIRFSGTTGSQKISTLSDAYDQPMPIARLEPLRIGGIYPDTLEDRRVVSLEQVPPLLIDSLIAVEDRRFYEHWGISPRGIARALIADIKAGAAVQGGSTLTQQLVKNFYLTSERSLSRKVKEILMAPLLELHYEKDEILQAYLNEVYFGQSGKRSIQGVGLGSQYYFGQPLNELQPHQIAFMVGIIKGPTLYDPWRRPDQSIERRNLVLSVMASEGVITEQQKIRYQNMPLDIWQRPARSINPYPAYMSLVRTQLKTSFEQGKPNDQGVNIYTALDPLIQRKLEQVAEAELASLEKQRNLPEDTLETAAVVTGLGSSRIVAMIGGRQPGFDGYNRAVNAERAIGSLIKPFVYLTALEKQGNSLALWEPKNYNLESHGSMIMLDAFIHSYNQAAARLGLDQGVESVFQTIERLGVELDWRPYPSTLLGSSGMSPLNLSSLYQTIANDGFQSTPLVIDSIYSADQQPLKNFRVEPLQVIAPEHVHLIQYALQMVMLEGTGHSAFNWLDKAQRVAGKTGTTNDQRDSWFAGYGGEYLAIFWVGRDDNEPMPLTGASGALRLWSKLMRDIEHQPIDFIKPESIEYIWVNRHDGSLSASHCEGAILLPIAKDSKPTFRDECSTKVAPRLFDWFKNILDF